MFAADAVAPDLNFAPVIWVQGEFRWGCPEGISCGGVVRAVDDGRESVSVSLPLTQIQARCDLLLRHRFLGLCDPAGTMCFLGPMELYSVVVIEQRILAIPQLSLTL